MGQSSSDAMRKKLVHFARKNLGKPYKYGAKPSEAPKIFDCSSFTQYLYKKIGVDLPRTAIEQAAVGELVSHKKEPLQVGDLVFIKGGWGRYSPAFPNGIGHVAMFIGKDVIIEAKWKRNKDGSDGGGVIESPANAFLNREPLAIVKRIF